jgi:hexosaminidase
MKIDLFRYTICLVLALSLTSCQTNDIKLRTLALIPLPTKIEQQKGILLLKGKIRIVYKNDALKTISGFLVTYLHANGLQAESIRNTEFDNKKADIILLIDETARIPFEGYLLDINKSQIILTATSPQGIFYGIQTIRQLLPYDYVKTLKLPCIKITDNPRFAWRGMHLDVSRHFMPKEFIKKYIDFIAFLKMNIFHWHLVDDQGWRIEIKQYPKLTEVGAWRDETLISYYDDPVKVYDGQRYGGFYTHEVIREIVQYAADRFITVVPEIEIPGHSQAAIAAYPQLGCTMDSVKVRTKWGISPYIYNIEDSTFKFLEGVFNEVVELFPSEYIHIGGDEALKNQWKASKSIQKKMKKLDIENEAKLQSYFIGKIADYLLTKGRSIIGWDEILEGGLLSDAAVMSWRGTEGGIEAARQGHKVVMTPTKYCYFDYYQSSDSSQPMAFNRYLPINEVYSFNPVPKGLNEQESKLIIGAQGNVWTEYMKTPEHIEYMIFPRIFAMAEVLWTPQDKRNYEDFVRRLLPFESFLKKNNINYAPFIFHQ